MAAVVAVNPIFDFLRDYVPAPVFALVDPASSCVAAVAGVTGEESCEDDEASAGTIRMIMREGRHGSTAPPSTALCPSDLRRIVMTLRRARAVVVMACM